MSTEKDAMELALEAAIAQAHADDGEQEQLPNDGGEAGSEPVAVEQPDKPADNSEKHDGDGDGDKPDGYRKAVVHHRRRAQQAEAQLQQEREQREALAAEVAAMKTQLAQAKQSGFEPRELPNEVTPEMLQAVREGDPDAIADVTELLLRQRAPVATPVPVASEQQQAAGLDPLALRGTEHQPVLDTLMEWRDDAQDGLGNVAWDTAVAIEAALRNDPQYSHVSTEVFYKTVVERTRERIQQGGKLKAAQQLAGSADKMPESLSAAGSGVRGGEIDPVSQMMNLEGQALVDYINNLTPAALAKVMGAGAF